MKMVGFTESEIIAELKANQESALKDLFDLFFQKLYKYAAKIVNEKDAAEEIVQDVFINLWNGRETLTITQSIEAYLTTAVKNRSINHLKKKYVLLETGSDDEIVKIHHSDQSDQPVITNELDALIQQALTLLPEKTALVFSLSRNSELSHNEIAAQLQITTKTVEYHMANALKHLRTFLAEHGYSIALISLLQ
ncbi:MAG: RNA polymerase sigma-70 factor [Cyclobacteriaceae bacterium]